MAVWCPAIKQPLVSPFAASSAVADATSQAGAEHSSNETAVVSDATVSIVGWIVDQLYDHVPIECYERATPVV
jgi:hypothetical protein